MKFQTKVERLAAADAYEWGMAGLMADDIAWKNERITGYGEAFTNAFNTQSLAREAKWLGDARKRLEKKGFTGEKISKKGRNIKIVLLVAGTLYVANEMGYLEPVKTKYRRTRLWWASVKEDPEAAGYKAGEKLGEKLNETIGDAIFGEERPDRFKNRKTVPGETVKAVEEEPDKPKSDGDDPDIIWPHAGY